MSRRSVRDLSGLPNVSLGPDATIWWGNMLMFTIEGTMFAMVAVTYFYLRYQLEVWPPPGADRPSWLWPTATAVALLAACAPGIWIDQAAKRKDRRPLLPGILTVVALGVVALAARWMDFATLDFKWSEHAYGSIVWTALGLHTAHLIAATLESSVMAALLIVGPFREKHLVDVRITSSYWYFITLAWLPFYAIFVLAPR
jgi:heme/copper-type cytochrome/quinol oxidase subunit 3